MQAEASLREQKKLEATLRREREAAERSLKAALKDALKEPEVSRSEAASELIASHPTEAAALREAMDKAAKLKQQQEINATEFEEDEGMQREKVKMLAQMLREAEHAVVYTGAGLSTAASIPDYRGPNGLWTMHNKKGGAPAPGAAPASAVSSSSTSGARNAPCAARAAMGQSFADARPTAGHMALAALTTKGHVKQIISQNVDGLHMRSGVPATKLCELHGNVFRERCPACGKEYLRGFDVTGKSAYHRHGTERVCDRAGCVDVTLRDTIVYFGERVHPPTLETAQHHSSKCDLAIFIGSSLKVLQAYPYIWAQPPKPAPRKRFVIINLQPTPKDRIADLRINGRCDTVLEMLLASMRLSSTNYSPTKDAVYKLAPVAKLPAPGNGSKQRRGSPNAPEVSTVKVDDDALAALQGVVVAPAADLGHEDAGDEEDMDEEDGGAVDAGPEQMPARKRRRKGKAAWKKRSMPRAFPAEPPPPPQAASLPPEPACAIPLAAPVAHPSEVELAADLEQGPPSSSARRRGRATSPRFESSAPAQAPPAASPPAAPPATQLPLAIKCAAKCGFFASGDSEYCSKCRVKREAEMAAWHGSRSRKSAK